MTALYELLLKADDAVTQGVKDGLAPTPIAAMEATLIAARAELTALRECEKDSERWKYVRDNIMQVEGDGSKTITALIDEQIDAARRGGEGEQDV